MGNRQLNYDVPAGATRRVRSAASGLHKPAGLTARRSAVGRFGADRTPEPTAEEKPATPEPYSLPTFLGMFDLPADSSERVKAVVRGQDDA
ncbi:hypothetical protein [Amycolatopsis albispora]|uniref:hypothetical protein n=1 Tax=Amycolatopsis albispora TaxID=1804986 RepID=UPI0013B3C15C|nr:hypothetical protein [Amycolatopsis albispora]